MPGHPPIRPLFAVLFVVLMVCAALRIFLFPHRSLPPAGLGADLGQVPRELLDRFAALEAREREVASQVWAKELLAQQCGQIIEQLWDSLNAATNKYRVLASFPVGELVLGKLGAPRSIAHGIELCESLGAGPRLTPELWRKFLAECERGGWDAAQTEFRHNRFDVDAAGLPLRSQFYFSTHLTRSGNLERAELSGDLIVDWAPQGKNESSPKVKRIDASHLTLKTRRAEPAFRPILTQQIAPPEGSYFIDPLILYDLDGDGLSEIILAAKNLVFRRRADGHFEPETLCRHPPGLIFTGIIADFDGDGAADFLCAKFEGLFLFKGSPSGAFDEPGQLVWPANPHLKYAQVMTCGDLDGDGDLDVWLGQYKVPYGRGQMPTPYYDANDGHPAYLLLNDGRGNFTDATAAAGLEQKRWRRSYSASFVDLDGDGDLDLIVVSDFAGLDIYTNDGRGHFTDVTRDWVAETHAFGMGHALADFNADGRLDLLMIGMNSSVADRLEHLGLVRPGRAEDAKMRSRMTYGNRLFLGRSGRGFDQPSFNDSIARSGWSWGCSAFDFDNDGYPDVYIGNGHQTRRSVRDYEPEFWLHDIYVGDSHDDVVRKAYFDAKQSRTSTRGESYGGHDLTRLYLNLHGDSFLEIAHLMGIALRVDSRNVVADDLDGDGRMDLLITTFEVWPEVKQTLQVFKNTLSDEANWIGLRFREQGGGISPVGTRVTLRHAAGAMTKQIVTGDAFRSQNANTVHFGLGRIAEVESVEVRWPNGRTAALRHPGINQYHAVSPPKPGDSSR